VLTSLKIKSDNFNVKGVERMPIKSNMKGLDKLKRNLENLDGTHEVGLSEIMTADFIAACSAFSGLDQLFSASGFKVDSAEDLKAIPDNEWDEFIVSNTTFESWKSMQDAAIEKYMKSKIFNGLKVR
jgi:hypothetical protein